MVVDVPARPRRGEALLRIDCDNAAQAEPALQQVDAVRPDAVEGGCGEGVARLFRVHAALQENLNEGSNNRG